VVNLEQQKSGIKTVLKYVGEIIPYFYGLRHSCLDLRVEMKLRKKELKPISGLRETFSPLFSRPSIN